MQMKMRFLPVLVIAFLTLSEIGAALPAKPRVAIIEARITGITEYLTTLGYSPENITQNLMEDKFRFRNIDILVFAPFSTGDRTVQAFLNEKSDLLREFVRKGGFVLMFSQRAEEQSREAWLPESLCLLRADRQDPTLDYVNEAHPIFSSPHALNARQLSAAWPGGPISRYSFRAVSRGWILVAQDEKGRSPWCVEFGWGKGRAVFLACSPISSRRSGETALVQHFLENILTYGSAVIRGRPAPLPDHAVVHETKNGVLPLAAYYTTKAGFSFDSEVNAAVDRGVAFLKDKQLASGAWDRQNSYEAGTAALVLVALLGSGVDKNDPTVIQAMDFLRRHPPGQYTYDLGLTLMAMDAWAAPLYERFELEKLPLKKRKAFQFQRDLSQEDRQYMEKCLDSLISNQAEGGWWSYGPDPGPMTDLSNTQMAILGLWAASRCDLKVPNGVWNKVIQRLLESQESSGDKVTLADFKAFEKVSGKAKFYANKAKARAWGYRSKGDRPGPPGGGGGKGPGGPGGGGKRAAPPENPEDRITGSRTAMGVSSLLISLECLTLNSRSKAASFAKEVRDAARDGLAWLWAHWSVDENPEAGRMHYFYYLYALERLGIVSSKTFIGDRDWYHEGAIRLLDEQYASGAWGDGVIDTCFALMFLKRTTPPPVFTAGR